MKAMRKRGGGAVLFQGQSRRLRGDLVTSFKEKKGTGSGGKGSPELRVALMT